MGKGWNGGKKIFFSRQKKAKKKFFCEFRIWGFDINSFKFLKGFSAFSRVAGDVKGGLLKKKNL